jgi:hypothetical protein
MVDSSRLGCSRVKAHKGLWEELEEIMFISHELGYNKAGARNDSLVK